MAENIRVLYAEDHPPDADLTKAHFQLNAPDFELHIVETGRLCLTRLNEEKYDALLLDNHLPDMDGVDVLNELAAKEVSLPVVVVTGVGDETLVVHLLRLGAWDYVAKQGNYIQSLPAVLKNAVAEYRTAQAQGVVGPRRTVRVLYVEHHPIDIDLTLKHFADSAAYINVKVVRSSQEALELLRDNNFDVVLADLRMPDMNALDLLREVKQRGLHAPFIIVTGKGDEAAAVAALKLGAYDYIIKRENYLTQLPYAIENAISRFQLVLTNRCLQAELAERKRTEAENARLLVEVLGQRQRSDEIIASVPGIVWEASGRLDNADQNTDFVSNYVEHMLGYSAEQWLSIPNFWLTIVHPDDRLMAAREAAESFASGEDGISQFRWIAKDGRVVWVEARSTVIFCQEGHPVGMRGVTTDITARKEAEVVRAQLEGQLRHAQKMESIGQLAGGIAHDFNNLLTVINGYSDLILMRLEPRDPLNMKLTEIRKAGDRAATLTRQLLAFSRKQVLQPRALALNSLITESAQMLKRLLGESIELVTVLDPGLGTVKADAGQIDQVIFNLAVNARDAMPDGGRLTVQTRNHFLDDAYAQVHPSLQPGAYVMLVVTDTGGGMNAETLSHIFEPFFTTKESGKGTGLGLSTVYGIVKQSGGSIWPYSEPGAGTTFKVYLPRVDEPVVEFERRRSEPESPRGSETVLVVEDDHSVRELTCQALRAYGYQVIDAANAGEALLACEKLKESIPLMITDLLMPLMSGPELASRLRQLRPDMRVLYMSGYAGDSVVRLGVLDSSLSFIEKPFTPTALALAVREVLDQQTQPAGRSENA